MGLDVEYMAVEVKILSHRIGNLSDQALVKINQALPGCPDWDQPRWTVENRAFIQRPMLESFRA